VRPTLKVERTKSQTQSEEGSAQQISEGPSAAPSNLEADEGSKPLSEHAKPNTTHGEQHEPEVVSGEGEITNPTPETTVEGKATAAPSPSHSPRGYDVQSQSQPLSPPTFPAPTLPRVTFPASEPSPIVFPTSTYTPAGKEITHAEPMAVEQPEPSDVRSFLLLRDMLFQRTETEQIRLQLDQGSPKADDDVVHRLQVLSLNFVATHRNTFRIFQFIKISCVVVQIHSPRRLWRCPHAKLFFSIGMARFATLCR